MALRPSEVLEAIRVAGKPVAVRELIRLARLHPGQQTELKRLLRELVRDGTLQKVGKRVQLPQARAKPGAEEREGGRAGVRGASGGFGARGARGEARGSPGAHGARGGRGETRGSPGGF